MDFDQDCFNNFSHNGISAPLIYLCLIISCIPQPSYLFKSIHSYSKNSKHSKEFTKIGAKKQIHQLRDTKSTHTDKLCFYKLA